MSKVESGTEFINERGQTVWNDKAGAIVFDNNTGQERLQFSHNSGANLNFNNKTVSMFAPNNKQELIYGDKFSTTAGDVFYQSQSNKEERAFGDYTIIAGSPNFFIQGLANDWNEANREIANAKAGPELSYGGVGNNSGVEFPTEGTPDSDSGAVEGGSYAANPAQANVQSLMEEKAADIAEIEQRMGEGGSIKFLTTKHLHLQAGAKPVTFDSGLIVKNGRSVTKRKYYDGGLKEEKTNVPVYESKDTASAVPFGDVNISAGTKMRVNVGAGGVGIKTAGDVNITSTGRTTIGGAEVSIGGATDNSAGRVTILSDNDLYMEATSVATRNSPYINDVAESSQITYITPEAIFTGNLHVVGNLTVEGNITVNGSTGITVPNGDVKAGDISLKSHVHGGVETGGGSTSGPR